MYNNKIIKISIAFIIVNILCLIVNAQDEKISDIFTNNKFASVIAQKLNKSVSDNVSQSELDTITGATIVAGASNVTEINGIGRLTNLKGIVIAGSNISEIPQEIGNNINLAILDINGSKINKIPTIINNLTNLKTLDLAQNEIMEVNNDFTNLTNLTKVDLSQNKISKYDASFPSISELNLSNNLLTLFPETIIDSKSLSILNISSNQLSNVSLNLDSLPLTQLDISRNKIVTSVSEIALKFGKIDKYSLNNHSQVALLDNVYLYNNNNNFTGEDFMPEIIKQIRSDNGSLNGIVKWYITVPSKKYQSPINGIDGSEINTSNSIFNEYGEYTIELATSNNSMRYWGYSSYKTKLIKIDAQAPSISVSHDYLELYQGDTFDQITINNSLESQMDINHHNESIAKCENGLIKANDVGETKIIFKAYDNYTQSKEHILNVKVLAKPITNLDISGLPNNIYVGDKFTLTPSINDQLKDNGWSWDKEYFNATFNSPATFIALKKGTTTISYTSLSGITKTLTITINDKIKTSSIVSINQTSSNIPISGNNILSYIISFIIIDIVLVALIKFYYKKSN